MSIAVAAITESADSAFACSGSSPTRSNQPERPTTLHLLGAGKVGRALLDRLPPFAHLRLIAVSDSTATLADPRGLEAAGVASWKAHGVPLLRHREARALPTEVAIAEVGADLVIDATATDLTDPDRAARRCRFTLAHGARLALAAKDALAAAADELLEPARPRAVGINAALGGTGARLVAELPELRARCFEVEIVGNASTSAILEEIEAGRSLDEGIARATARGLLESDPSQDLDGGDAAVKLAIVARALWGPFWDRPLAPAAIPREDIRAVDPELVRERARRGRTTRLVGRARRDGSLGVRYEEIPAGSPLAAPSDRVVYTYALDDADAAAKGAPADRPPRATTRVHVGAGLGPGATAEALLADVLALAGTARGGAR